MKRKNLFMIGILLITAISFQRCNIEPEYYSEISPSTFFDSQDKVYQRFERPFAAFITGHTIPRGYFTAMQMLSTDEIVMPNRAGDWYDDGFYLNTFYHSFSPGTEAYSNYTWEYYGTVTAQAWSALEDIDKFVDFDAMGFPTGTRESMLNQLKVLVAYTYLIALDHFGGVPIYTSNNQELQPRASDQETFDFIEKLLKEALPTLPKRVAGEAQNMKMTQGVAAALLARLYFNAESYIKKNMYSDAATICEAILNGTYGSYAQAASYQEIFGFNNEACNEVIWTFPSDASYRAMEGSNRNYATHYGTWEYFNNDNAMSWNGLCLIPSLDINGKSYKYGSANPSPNGTYKLGSPYAKFEDTDIRKQNYLFNPTTKNYTGMFLAGKLINPFSGTACLADGSREYPKGDTIPMVDQIAQLSPTKNYPDGRKEGAMYAEENSGVRLLKYSPTPDKTNNAMWKNSDLPVIRLTEIKYILAECKYRNNDKPGAAALINSVRERYFTTTGGDPNPVTTANLDDYRFLDEWLIEFIGEARRRTDLIRFGKFTTEAWWDHPADGPGKEYLNRFPIPEGAFSANPKLVQNPGYN
jgi:hypothetical protein